MSVTLKLAIVTGELGNVVVDEPGLWIQTEEDMTRSFLSQPKKSPNISLLQENAGNFAAGFPVISQNQSLAPER